MLDHQTSVRRMVMTGPATIYDERRDLRAFGRRQFHVRREWRNKLVYDARRLDRVHDLFWRHRRDVARSAVQYFLRGAAVGAHDDRG
jgi:hypothetical protein